MIILPVHTCTVETKLLRDYCHGIHISILKIISYKVNPQLCYHIPVLLGCVVLVTTVMNTLMAGIKHGSMINGPHNYQPHISVEHGCSDTHPHVTNNNTSNGSGGTPGGRVITSRSCYVSSNNQPCWMGFRSGGTPGGRVMTSRSCYVSSNNQPCWMGFRSGGTPGGRVITSRSCYVSCNIQSSWMGFRSGGSDWNTAHQIVASKWAQCIYTFFIGASLTFWIVVLKSDYCQISSKSMLSWYSMSGAWRDACGTWCITYLCEFSCLFKYPAHIFCSFTEALQ